MKQSRPWAQQEILSSTRRPVVHDCRPSWAELPYWLTEVLLLRGLASRECGKHPVLQAGPDVARPPSSICSALQMCSVAAPAQLTRPGSSAQGSGVCGWEPGPATSPVCLGSFPASSHMISVSVYFSLWPPFLQCPHASVSVYSTVLTQPLPGALPGSSFWGVSCFWRTLLTHGPHLHLRP